MKHFLTVLLCLLLCGCASQQESYPTETAPQAPTESAAVGMYDPSHPMSARYPDQIRSYPLTQRNVHGLRAFGSDVLLLSGQGNTTLTLLSGYGLQLTAARTVGFELTQEDPSLQIHEGFISFFNPELYETVVLDHRLQEVRRIAVPRDISGKPILSADTTTLCYCTPWAVVAWDLDSGIRRTVKEIQHSDQELISLLWNDQILACALDTEILLLSAEDGREMHTLPKDAKLFAQDADYFLSRTDGFQNLMIFSRDGAANKLLLPEKPADTLWYLEQNDSVITVSNRNDGICLDYYDLETGMLQSALQLEPLQTPNSIVSCADHTIYILVYDPAADCDTIYRWEVPFSPEAENAATYTFPYHSEDAPDVDALNQCQEIAHSIGRKYGISIQIWEDACQYQPWDYTFTPEYLAPVLRKELQLLDQRLAGFPPDVLQQTVSHFNGLTICLVRQIFGTAETDSPASPTGIQFFRDNHAYVVIATGKHSEQGLYHELYHVMETHILTNSSALDHWETLNPIGFSYGTADAPEAYLQGQTRAFVDRYSMSALKEDRARVMENAMLSGKKELFQSEYMQRKLTSLCQSIREAYRLKKAPEALPWEQYLVTPLTPNT